MIAAGDIAQRSYVIRLVGQDETSGGVAFQQSSKYRRIGRVAANDAMRTELENIADPGDRSCGVGLERPLLEPLCGVAENDMVDLGRREPGDLYWRIQQNQFFKLDLQRVEIPLALFRESIDGKAKYAVFGGLKWPMRTHGTRSRPNCFAAS